MWPGVSRIWEGLDKHPYLNRVACHGVRIIDVDSCVAQVMRLIFARAMPRGRAMWSDNEVKQGVAVCSSAGI